MKFLRGIVCGIALAAVAVVSASGPSRAQDKIVRIGFQKYGKLVLLKSKGSLEEKLKPLGFKVDVDRISGRPATAGSGQCRRDRLRQYRRSAADFRPGRRRSAASMSRTSRPRPAGEAILVPKDSPIKTVADLKGRKVALNKGSNVHYLLVRALEKAGRQIHRNRAGVPGARRRARGVRARLGRCLGDLGSVPGRRRSRDRRTHAWPTAPASSPIISSIWRREKFVDAESARVDALAGALTRWMPGRRATSRRSREAAQPGDRHPGTGPQDRARAPVLRHQAARRYRHRRAAGASPTPSTARPASPSRSHIRRSVRRRDHEHSRTAFAKRQRSLVPADARRRPLSRHASIGGRNVDLHYLRQIAQAADDLGYYGVLLPTGRVCEDSWVVASALAPLTERLRFLVAVRPGLQSPTRGGAHDRDARPDLRGPSADQRGDRRRPGREQGRRHLPGAR